MSPEQQTHRTSFTYTIISMCRCPQHKHNSRSKSHRPEFAPLISGWQTNIELVLILYLNMFYWAAQLLTSAGGGRPPVSAWAHCSLNSRGSNSSSNTDVFVVSAIIFKCRTFLTFNWQQDRTEQKQVYVQCWWCHSVSHRGCLSLIVSVRLSLLQQKEDAEVI